MSAGAVFEQLPEAPAPPGPNEPGGSGGRFDPSRWKPRSLTLIGPGYVTLQTAAELFDVQRERLQVACWRGTLPAVKIASTARTGHGQWLVHPGHVARYLATTMRGVSNRRRADELSPARLERERQRLLASADGAEQRARVARAKLAALEAEAAAQATAGGAGASPADVRRLAREAPGAASLALSAQNEETKAKDRRRLAAALAREAQARAEAPSRRAGADSGERAEDVASVRADGRED